MRPCNPFASLETLENKLTLSFRNVCFSVQIADKDAQTKPLLTDVCGRVPHGELLAIMGPSGAGKSTLLDLLCGKTKQGVLSGDIFLNGNAISPQVLRCLSGFVPQHDSLLATPTVREAILFSAMLRLPRSIPVRKKEQLVDELIKQLDLVNCKDTLVGGDLVRGVSGGEKKRVSVGVELITDPGLLFLDEPTTGLDSSTSMRLISILQKMSRRGRSIACTIHQPDARVFDLFDKLLLLDSRGGLAYYGPTQHLLAYLETFDKRCPDYHNPADFALDVLHQDSKDGLKMRSLYAQSEYRSKLLEDVDADAKEPRALPPYSVSAFATPFWYQLWVVMQRSWKHSVRNETLFPTMVGSLMVFSVLIGAMYYQLPIDEANLRDRISAIVFLASINAFMAPFCIIAGYPQDKVPYNVEKDRRMYHPMSLGLSISMHSIPVIVPTVLVGCVISYYMIGLRDSAECVLKFILVNELLLECSMAFATTVSLAFSKSSAIASLVFSFLVLSWSFLLPFYIPESRIPDYMIWIERSSFLKYATNALMVNEFAGQTYECTRVPCVPKAGSVVVGNFSIPVDKIPYDCYQVCEPVDGDELLEYYGTELRFWDCIGILVSMIAIWRLLLLWVLWKKN
eukprot:TRINITY_DN1895_c0_g1_i4.p1 TRINITY_DN1895_c0_g1~~TRINITY_DN1895_c0_g1_i4.p1  ORF type:complete len:625 (-),score=118.01 TRINITY_DN1895_c0_g1_i4:28-1902(-)